MTPASDIALSPARARSARPSDRARVYGGRWERLVAVLGVCLPIPLFALTGLSIPLPAGVERIGAALAAWTDTSADGADPLGLGDRGSIVLASGERALVEVSSGPEPDTARRVFAFAGPLAGPSGGADDGRTSPKDGGGGSGGNGGNGGGGSTPPDPGGGDPDDDPGLVEETVENVTEEPLVEEVDKTLEDALSGLGL